MYILKCFDKWERVMAHVVERTSADIADRVVIRALAKLQLQQNERESLSQENCIQTDIKISDIYKKAKHHYRNTFEKKKVIRNAREEGAKEIERIHKNVDDQDGKPKEYSLHYVSWWVGKEVNDKIRNIDNTHKALEQIMESEFLKKEDENGKRINPKQQENEKNKKKKTDSNFGIWAVCSDMYRKQFVLSPIDGNSINRKLKLLSLSSGLEKPHQTIKLENINNTNDFDEDAMNLWREALEDIELLQKRIIKQWRAWNDFFEIVQTALKKNPNPTPELQKQATDIEQCLLNSYFKDRKLDTELWRQQGGNFRFWFPKEVTMNSSNNPETSFVTNYCSILINYIPLCYAMGYLDMRKDANTNPEGRFLRTLFN